MLGSSILGLEAFLPPSDSKTSSSEPSSLEVEAVGLATTYFEASFTLPPPTSSIRNRCLALIQRYAYVIGTSPASFIAVRSTESLQEAITRMDRPGGLPALLAMNDDINDGEAPSARGVDQVFRHWMERILPLPSRWEEKIVKDLP